MMDKVIERIQVLKDTGNRLAKYNTIGQYDERLEEIQKELDFLKKELDKLNR